MTQAPAVRNAGNIIARNVLFTMGGQIALRLGNFLFNILVIRRLGDQSFGQYSVVLAWAGLFSVIGDLGITQYFTREIARDPQRSNELFWDVTALRFLLAIIAFVVTVVGAVLRNYPQEIVIAVALYTLTYFLQAVLAPLTSVITGNERLDVVSVITVIGQVVFMVSGAIVLFAGGGLIGLVIISFVNLPLMIALSLWTVRRFKMPTPKFQVSPSIWWKLVKVSFPFALIQLTLTFNFQIDTIILQNFASYQIIGWYNASYQFARSLLAITSAVIIALPLTMAREHVRDPKVVSFWYFRSVKFMVFIGLPVAVGGTLLADKIIPLFYGKSFTPAVLLFAILIWDIPLLMYTALSGNLTTAIKREKTAMIIYLMVGGFNTVTNLILQPTYGVIAASIITIGSETVGAALFYILFRQEFGSGLSLNHLLRIVLAALIMGVAVFLLHNLSLVITITAGVAVYLICIYMTGALTAEERRMLIEFTARKLGRFIPMRLRPKQS